ncbi:hypothetical protein [Shewanella gaetbuli]|uniref:Uncharacterized protein n=1 Tax=Shewanella gaetbuli TaxID=220752 RepID=A0A9X1ZJW6_9GAMM|nr:hypothetical protein [Shewanella gaetbuli]MCL1141150.1 hypothetical protein [Shewanella gaetbuli]
MNKMAVAVAVLALGAGGYYFSQQNDAVTVTANPMLDYIPADTLVFSGQLTPFPIADYLHSTAGNKPSLTAEQLGDISQFSQAHEKFFFSLYKQYLQMLNSPEQLITHYGLPETMQSFFYTLGALPVMKLQIANPQAFWAELDRAEQESGFTHSKSSIGGVDYRAYRLTGEFDEETIDVIFAEQQGWLTMTLNTSFNQPALFETALGVNKVPNPLSATTMLNDIATKHDFTNDSISFINHVELVKGLTTEDGNMLAKQLTKLANMQNDDALTQIRTPVCQSEFMAIANNWPRTVLGFKSFNVTREQSDFDARFVIESNNTVILNALSNLRGFIPDFDDAEHILSLGMGVDVGKLASSLNDVYTEMTSTSYQCQALAELQQGSQEFNPAMLGMMTGMANGVKGVSLSVLDYTLTEVNGSPAFKKLDALMTLSADNPSMLLSMVKPFYPPLAQVDLSSGEVVDVSSLLMLPPELGVQANMAIKGNHLVIYSGKGASLAERVAKQSLTSNGLISFGVDYQKMISPLVTMMEQNGEPVPEELTMMKDYKMKLKMSVDITSEGIEVGSKMSAKAP